MAQNRHLHAWVILPQKLDIFAISLANIMISGWLGMISEFIYRTDFMGRSLSHALKNVDIPVEWLNETYFYKYYPHKAQC